MAWDAHVMLSMPWLHDMKAHCSVLKGLWEDYCFVLDGLLGIWERLNFLSTTLLQDMRELPVCILIEHGC
uniref:Uncharacterized protein n=1 Tax=Nelumbo nucifera TaxID=4432 RepID=A0A822XLV1_NELNU|nr:TPA_asm: hypothetical protein HUJ06_021644 [Nelumbo nucifera]